ncbi:unnamed protein product [Clonostachys rosea]|uniref:Xylanolytic transcriptional activator regulatory domain-containing protein n=1 Tax=Bionectria ochroleuca TaxID=29856 RepID=A0ABY6V1Y5_BIOOC|nr:unnamed protein product [Clonostachys rosea]
MAVSRPQVGIERLPARRMSNEPRESMNCKSCRKRKVGSRFKILIQIHIPSDDLLNAIAFDPRVRHVRFFNALVSMIYGMPSYPLSPMVRNYLNDAVPKKRGPKTDVLDALLKRVDGLEAKLREKNAEQVSSSSSAEATTSVKEAVDEELEKPPQKRLTVDTRASPNGGETLATPVSMTKSKERAPPLVPAEALIDTYFSRYHAKPYHILDESTTRQRAQLGQLPDFLANAIFAVASRYTAHPDGYQAAVNLSEDYAARSRKEIDADEPSVDGLQAALLLVMAFIASGKGRKAYMLLAMATGMAMALELHREMDEQRMASSTEKETRRRLFWTCYLLDRFTACGSKRPSLISDKTIMLRLPSWVPSPSAGYIEGEFFQAGSNLHHFQGSDRRSQGSTGMLIDITRILGVTNRYLAAGGVRGDSHFPWHSLSNLSKIRQDLDTWASGTDDAFSSLETLFGHPDSTTLVLSKLIYHLIHCLIYRPFLPIDLSELAGNGQHESWQIEATNMCFLHANAISELTELGKQTPNLEWPAFVGYCLCTAGTVHIHGAHYSKQGAIGEMNVFSSSSRFLPREMQHLSELSYEWASVQHHRETLQGIYNAHTELVKTLTGNMRYTPSFHLEDFFERYSNIGGLGGPSFQFDAANLSLSDAVVNFTADTFSGHDLYAPRTSGDRIQAGLARGSTAAASSRVALDLKTEHQQLTSPRRLSFANRSMSTSSSVGLSANAPSAVLAATNTFPHSHNRHNAGPMEGIDSPVLGGNSAEQSRSGQPSGFPLHTNTQIAAGQGLSQAPAGGPFSPNYSFGNGAGNAGQVLMNDSNAQYDPMFGTLPTNAFSSPAAWHGDDATQPNKMNYQASGMNAHSPGAGSNNGSLTTTQADEKDPFLSLLEQLAENDQRSNNGFSDLDFFLTGGGSVG